MIKTVILNDKLKLTYSDMGMYIYKEDKPDALYLEAVDVLSKNFNYVESNEPISHE